MSHVQSSMSPKTKQALLLEDLEFQLLEYLYINGIKRPSEQNLPLYEQLATRGYIKHIPSEDGYRVTVKGKKTLLCDADTLERNIPNQKFFKGDFITLCPMEYDGDSFDQLFRIQFYREDLPSTFITLLEYYDVATKKDGEDTYKGITVDTVEMSHCLAEEIEKQERHWEEA